jgi:hypothetical protein
MSRSLPLSANSGSISSSGSSSSSSSSSNSSRIILRWIFRKLEGVVGTGWSWPRIGTGGGLLWVR